MDMDIELCDIDIDKIDEFSLKGLYYGRVSSIYDGDTCTLIIKMRDEYKKITCRIYGIDTPELHSHIEEEKTKANISKNILINLLTENNVDINEIYKKIDINKISRESKKIILVECLDIKEKYGRILVNIYISESKIEIWKSPEECREKCDGLINISEYMVNNKYAKEYFGGAK
jgi:endonuclease YncB( thermonuclease family)